MSKEKEKKNYEFDMSYPNAVFDRLNNSQVKILIVKNNLCFNSKNEIEKSKIITDICENSNKITILKNMNGYNLKSSDNLCLTKLADLGYVELRNCDKYDESQLWKIKKNDNFGLLIENVNTPNICLSNESNDFPGAKWITDKCNEKTPEQLLKIM